MKIQAPGPITLAAQVEIGGGHRAITDAEAVCDLTPSLAEGVAADAAEMSRRLGVPAVVQFDEPLLPVALAGRLASATSMAPVRPVEESVATELLNTCASYGWAAVHCCAIVVPWSPAAQRDNRTAERELISDAARTASPEQIAAHSRLLWPQEIPA